MIMHRTADGNRVGCTKPILASTPDTPCKPPLESKTEILNQGRIERPLKETLNKNTIPCCRVPCSLLNAAPRSGAVETRRRAGRTTLRSLFGRPMSLWLLHLPDTFTDRAVAGMKGTGVQPDRFTRPNRPHRERRGHEGFVSPGKRHDAFASGRLIHRAQIRKGYNI